VIVGYELASDLDSVAFVSPHHDDVALSCGDLLAARPGSQVVTVFASGPPHVNPLPAWDLECGYFKAGDDVAAIRAREDAEALGLLGATGHNLDFWPLQYRGPQSGTAARLGRLARLLPRTADGDARLLQSVTDTLGEALVALEFSACFVPLGVSHPDHRLTAEAALQLARRMPEKRWYMYADLPYSKERADHVAAAGDVALASGFRLEPVIGDARTSGASVAPRESKRAAVACYRSQLGGLGERVELAIAGPETYYCLVDGNRPADY
jgi:LmbE family N-acetylglucosaminyl deacetylase